MAGTSVKFGPNAATSITITSTTRLNVTVPAHAAGPVDVQVTTPSGISPVSSADEYTYATGNTGTLSVIAGRCVFKSPGPATQACIAPSAVAVDSAGNQYIADTKNDVIEKVATDGTLSIVAGTGQTGIPTAGPATSSDLGDPTGVAVDSSGNLYVTDNSYDSLTDADHPVVVKITSGGTLSIFAGTGNSGSPTAGPATSSDLGDFPAGVAVDSSDNVFIADSRNNVVEKVTTAGTLSVVAGTGTYGKPTPGSATSSRLGSTDGVAVDSTGNLYIADGSNYVVEKVTPGGILSIVAGSGKHGLPMPGSATSSKLGYPDGVAVDSSGSLYIADGGNYGNDGNLVVDKVTSGGTLQPFAGTGNSGMPTPGPATSSDLGPPIGVATDSSGNVYIADVGNFFTYGNGVVAKVTPGGTLSLLAGTINYGLPTAGTATSSDLGFPDGVAVDSSGNLYIADYDNSMVEEVTPSGALSVVAGTGHYGLPTSGPATSSDLGNPTGVAVDSAGNLYIADSDNSLVEKVTPGGTLSVVAGTGNSGPPTPGPATSSDLVYPAGVAVDSSSNLYIADEINSAVEKVTPDGTLSIFADRSDVGEPGGVAVDSSGNVLIVDGTVVERLTQTGTLSVVAGTGNSGPPTPGPATGSDLGGRLGVAVDPSGNVYIADSDNSVVEKVTPKGTLSVVAGTGNLGAPTPGPATGSNLDLGNPAGGVATDSSGNFYIADSANYDVEEVK